MSTIRPEEAEALLAEADWLRRLARGLVRDAHAAAEIEQETWLAALRARPAARAAELRAWLTVVARNFARRARRDAALRGTHEPRGAREERREGPDEFVARVELQRRLAEELLALDEASRGVLVLRYFDELSSVEIAERLSITHDAARQRLARALAKLRERLDRGNAGGRAGWMAALLPLAHGPKAAIPGGLILMGTKTKLVAALALAALAIWIWKGPLSPGPQQPEPPKIAGGTPDAPSGHEPPAEPVSALDAAASTAREPVLVPTPESRAADPAPQNVLRGIVLDPTDRPVEGARIVASSSVSYDYQTLDLVIAGRSQTAGEARSGADGRFELTLDPARAYQLAVDRRGFAQATLGRRRTGETVVVHLPHAAAIEGRVTQGAANAPIAGASVRCFLRGNDSRDGARFEQSTLTDAQGHYLIDTLPPGILFLEVHASGWPSPGWIEVHPEAGRTITRDVHVDATTWYTGRVLDARTRAPIEGAQLGTIWVLKNTVRSDAAGAFRLPLDEGSDGQIYVRAAGYGFRNFQAPDAQAAASPDGFEILLEPARSVRGRVVDDQGRPVAGAYVAACGNERGETQRHDWIGATTDDAGRYAIADLRPDLAHSLFVRAQGFGSCVYELPVEEARQASLELPDVVLRAAGAIRGRVVDENDRPLPDLDVELRGVNADRGRWNARGAASLDTYVGQRDGRTDDRGAFAFDELAAGDYEVSVRRDGHLRVANASVKLGSGERREGIQLVLPSGVTLTGRVRDRAGRGVRGVNVSVEPKETGLSDCDVRTGEDGTFRARGLAAGTYRIQLWPDHRDTGTAESKVYVHTILDDQRIDGRELDLVIEDGVWLVGSVVEANGTPVVDALVQVIAEGQENGQSASSDGQGRFRVAVERDKRYSVTARLVVDGRDRLVPVVASERVCKPVDVVSGQGDVRIVLPPK